jgi:Spy/CpxP family protein refolding chaperone
MKTILCLLALLAFVCPGRPAEPTHDKDKDNPIEQEFFPPEFLLAQREALGLSDTQLHDLQAVIQDAQPKFENLKGQLEERVKALKEVLRQPKPDISQTEEKLRTMLTQENEVKVFQMRLLLTLRNTLTPEQVEKAQQLRQHFNGANPTEGLAERLQAKFKKLRGLVEERAAGGPPPEDIVTKAREIQQLAQDGKPFEAEKKLDTLLSTLTAPNAKP